MIMGSTSGQLFSVLLQERVVLFSYIKSYTRKNMTRKAQILYNLKGCEAKCINARRYTAPTISLLERQRFLLSDWIRSGSINGGEPTATIQITTRYSSLSSGYD